MNDPIAPPTHGLRSGWVLVGATLIAWAFLLFGYNDSYPWLAIVEVLTAGYGIIIVLSSLWRRHDEMNSRLAWGAMAVSFVAFFVWCWVQVRIAPAYGTDEAAFDQYAAQLFFHGLNPYTHSMAPAFQLFHVSPDGATLRMSGAAVTSLSYPALSFLLYVPLLALGLNVQLAITVNIVMWALSILLSYVLVPRDVKPLIIVLGSFAVYAGFAVGGVTDALYVPLLILAIYQWDRWPQRRGWAMWISPVFLALAMSIKQTPWFIAPFLVIGLYLEVRQQGGDGPAGIATVGRYVWRTASVFFAVNAYFIAIDPAAWFRGVSTPFIDRLVPAGEGFVALSNFLGHGGGSLFDYTLLMAMVAVLCTTLYVVTFPQSKALMVFFPSVILFFASRSYTNYLVMLLLPALVAAWSIRPSADGRLPLLQKARQSRPTQISLGLSLVGVLVAGLLVVITPQPLAITIDSVTTTGQLATVISVSITVVNHTDHAVTPVFTSESGGAFTTPWNLTGGSPEIQPHSRVNLQIQAPNFQAQPSLTNGFQIAALTTSPEAVSVSAPYTPTNWHINLNPSAVNTPVVAGQAITFTAQVLSPTDKPIDLAGVPIYLGQVTYLQAGLEFSQASINGSPTGATPVLGLTNAHGEATFRVTCSEASINPIYFEGNLVNGSSLYPYGYSNIVAVRFN